MAWRGGALVIYDLHEYVVTEITAGRLLRFSKWFDGPSSVVSNGG